MLCDVRMQRVNEEKVGEMERMLRKRENDVHNKELSIEATLRAQRERLAAQSIVETCVSTDLRIFKQFFIPRPDIALFVKLYHENTMSTLYCTKWTTSCNRVWTWYFSKLT